jgi:phosphoserine phosphatase
MRYALTLIAPVGNIVPVAETVNLLAAHGIAVHQAEWLEKTVAYDMIIAAPSPDFYKILQHEAHDHWRVDVVLQPEIGREKTVLISDMDSTMIEQECIDELAARVGKKDYVAAITERAMCGELDFAEALRARVALLAGLSNTDLERTFQEAITLSPGAHTLVRTMAARGATCVLVSGGFTFFTARVAAALGFHQHEANELLFEHGHLTGKVREPILGADAKHESLLRHAPNPAHALAIGDGANDLPMLLAAGLGVAYRAKPKVREAVQAQLNFCDLTALLYAQAIPKKAWVA